MSGIQFRQGEVVLVPMPFSDLSESKPRPALIISNDAHNSKVDDIAVCGITSNIRDEEYSVIIEQKDMAEGILPFLSRIKVDKLFTLEKRIIKRKLGRVKPDVLAEVKKELAKLIT